MNFQNHPPVRLFLGDNAMRDNIDRFRIGKKALVVSGKHGADACGAMAEVDGILAALSIPYVRFTEITENPPAQTCYRGGQMARAEGCDFVIAIGGGSSLDGAKAIAAYAANPDMGVTEIFDGLKNPCLPLIAIPTTAGTGSEAVCYAVLTLPGGRQKKTFKDHLLSAVELCLPEIHAHPVEKEHGIDRSGRVCPCHRIVSLAEINAGKRGGRSVCRA